jgi:hypothetical protein
VNRYQRLSECPGTVSIDFSELDILSLTKKKPQNQVVQTMGKIPSVFSGPIVAPSIGGTRLKKAPHPMPLKTKNTEKIPTLDARGQTTNELRPIKSRQTIRLLRGPRRWSAV